MPHRSQISKKFFVKKQKLRTGKSISVTEPHILIFLFVGITRLIDK